METTQMQDRLTALEQSLDRLTTQQEKIVSIIATVDTSREADLLHRLEAAEAALAELKSTALTAAASNNTTRKTVPTGVTTMLAKQGVSLEHPAIALEASAVDAALANLSIEQRIAVKSELMRSGLLG